MSKVTLSDVASAAGVSIATASWAINDNKNVRIPQVTRERVRAVADKLGYRQNALAKGLASGTSSLIGFITDDIATTPFAGQIIEGAQAEAWKNGKLLLVVNTGGKESITRSAFTTLKEHQVQGIIYSTWFHTEISSGAVLDNKPDVLVNCSIPGVGIPSVFPDEVQGGYSATRILLDAGHRRIAFINDYGPSPSQSGRLEGYKRALEESGVSFDESLSIVVTGDQEGGYAAGAELLKTDATAVFCYNDRVAMGLYDSMRAHGVSLPEDMSIVGFDDQEVISAHLHPKLTTVSLPQYQLGVQGVRRLLSGTSSKDKNVKNIGSQTLVECPPVVRKSVIPRI